MVSSAAQEVILKAVCLKDEELISEILNKCEGINRSDLQFFTENSLYEIKNNEFEVTKDFKKFLETWNYFGFLENKDLQEFDFPINLAETE